jgi:hypothetical protein
MMQDDRGGEAPLTTDHAINLDSLPWSTEMTGLGLPGVLEPPPRRYVEINLSARAGNFRRSHSPPRKTDSQRIALLLGLELAIVVLKELLDLLDMVE